MAYDLKWIPTMVLVSPEGNLLGVTFHAKDMETLLKKELNL